MYKESSNQQLVQAMPAQITFDQHKGLISLGGTWLWSSIDERLFTEELKRVSNVKAVTVDGQYIDTIDTTGIYFIVRLLKYLKKNNVSIDKLILEPDNQKLFERVLAQLNQTEPKTTVKKRTLLVTSVGRDIFAAWRTLIALITFFGQCCVAFVTFIRSPRNLNWIEVTRTINDAGIKGMWVAALLSFLIGVTLAYQMAPQFVTYGANVYIVNFLGIALLKEVSPLLTAVIVAGRTGAAITAEIGTQKVQEEIDALQTMGISPIQRVVLPKIIGVMIAVPLITAIADIASMLGGAIVSNTSLSVNYSLFIYRLQNYVLLSNYACGIIKSIAFAFIVALVGCFCGLKVKGNANSIGEQTTRSVVTGIVLIVLVDAIFAIIFKTLGV